jgi:hypothetical protein
MLLGGRSPDYRRILGRKLPTRGTFPLSDSEQWPNAAFVPVTVAGAAPAFHRLPSPTNKRSRLFQKKKLLSSGGCSERRVACGGNQTSPSESLNWHYLCCPQLE